MLLSGSYSKLIMIIALSTSILWSTLVHLSWTNTGNFTIIPSSEVVAVGQRAVFRCRSPTAISILWIVNDSIVGRTPPPEIIPDTTGGGDNLVDILTIMASLEFNQTKVVCEARFEDVTTQSERSPPVYLLIQGNLGMGSNVRRSSSTITWEPPFSLDLTDVDPDIVYCVEVYNITCGVDDLLVGGCNVTETRYEDNRLQQGHIYHITIIPRNNIGQNAQNGTLFTKKEMFVSLTDPMTRIVLAGGSAMVSAVIQFKNYDAVVDRIQPESYFLSLQAIDGVKEPLMSLATTFSQDMNTTTLNVDQPLPTRRLWNYQVLALGCIENPVTNLSELLELSTHEFQNVFVNSINPGEIGVTGSFINGSTATAILVIVYSDSDVYYIFSSPSEEETNVRGLPSGLYNVSVFVVEENGLPFNRSATTPRSVSVMEGEHEINFQIEYEVRSMSTGVCITCTFLDSSVTDCVAVVHQRISQLGSSGLMNIIRSQKFNMSGSNAFGCIMEADLDQYQVGVVGGRLVETLPNQDSQVEIIVGVTVGILVPAVGLAAVSVIVVVTWKTKKKRSGRDIHGESGGSSSMRPLTKGAAHLQDETEAPAYAVLHRGPSPPAEVEELVHTYSVLDQYPPEDLDPDPSSAPSDLAYATVGPSPASREMVPQEFDHTVVEYSRVQ